MMEVIESYSVLLAVMLAVAGLMLIQLLVADVAGLIAKHAPGTTVPQDHGVFLFRAGRALANTNESITIFVLLCGLMIVYQIDPNHAANAALAYLVGRVGHSLCYWFDLRIPRSIFFVIALLALLAMMALCVMKFF